MIYWVVWISADPGGAKLLIPRLPAHISGFLTEQIFQRFQIGQGGDFTGRLRYPVKISDFAPNLSQVMLQYCTGS